MKVHTSGFKDGLIELGRQLKGIITYGNTVLEEEINSITPHFQADLLKSVMKQLDLELTVDLPIDAEINCQIGILVGNNYEMINFGNYIVFSSEKQEDKGTYKIVCYDKLLFSMKKNEQLNIQYPITIQNYLSALASKIGLTVATTSFYNQGMQIPSELYYGQEYTYRDILDEIAGATGSIICLNLDDEIVLKYPTSTGDTIDEDYLKDINVDFGQKYGPINSIVLSRSGESDNVYLRDEDSVTENGLTEIKIIDNQIMNFNNRSNFLQGILNALNGLYYYINDFNSTGILYYEVGDLYNVLIGENTYQCLMLNDEINVTTGIEEIIHTDMPEKSETDYSKADKTDMRINKTYLIVDKQNQSIDAVISQTVDTSNPDSIASKNARLSLRVDDLESAISDISDITIAEESDRANVQLTGINNSEPVMLKIHPTATNISYLYPREDLYPSDTQYMPGRRIRFIRTYQQGEETLTEDIFYTLPDDLLRYSDTVYDEFYLDYESQTCQVIKRCQYNADGTVSALGTSITTDYPYPEIILGEGDYQITISGYNYGYIYARLMAKNMYTTQFYTKVETESKINQKADQITLGVNQTLTNYSTTNQMNSAIELKANQITNTVSNTYETKVNSASRYNNLTSKYTQVDQKADGIITTVSEVQEQVDTNTNNINTNTANISTVTQTANGLTVEVAKKVGNNEVISKINQSAEAVTINANKINLSGKTINMTSDNIKISSSNFNVDKNGNMSCTNANITGGNLNVTGGTRNNPKLSVANGNNSTKILPQDIYIDGSDASLNINNTVNSSSHAYVYADDTGGGITLGGNTSNDITLRAGDSPVIRCYGNMYANAYNYNSKEEFKKNIVKFNEDAIKLILGSDLYSFNYRNEDDAVKKHIGFIIGTKYKTPKEIISESGDSIDSYSTISILWKAIQEQQQQIEQMKKEIEILKGGNE